MGKILVLEGGGIFGIGQANILNNIDVSKFEGIFGTSIGAANAAALASGMDVDLVEFFHKYMPRIFGGYRWRKYKPFTPKYGDKELNKALKETFGGMRFGDVKIPLFIVAVNMYDEKLKVFDSSDPIDAGWPLWEVVRCSVAAPTYFNPYKGYTDGGIYANTPTVVASAGAYSILGMEFNDIEICSIGTGIKQKNTDFNKHSYLSWGLWLLKAMLNGSSSTMNDYICRQLPLKNYTRIQFNRETDWAMDNPKHMLEAEKLWMPDIVRGIEIVKGF
jgi:predicted acylesterase/phospholipase RssA